MQHLDRPVAHADRLATAQADVDRLVFAHHPRQPVVDLVVVGEPVVLGEPPVALLEDPVEFGPLMPGLCREAQRIIDTARLSAERGETVDLVG